MAEKRTPRGHGGRGGPQGHGFQRPQNLKGTVKKLMGYIGRYKALLVVVAVCLVLSSLGNVAASSTAASIPAKSRLVMVVSLSSPQHPQGVHRKGFVRSHHTAPENGCPAVRVTPESGALTFTVVETCCSVSSDVKKVSS